MDKKNYIETTAKEVYQGNHIWHKNRCIGYISSISRSTLQAEITFYEEFKGEFTITR